MNEVLDFGKTIIGGADGPTSVFLAGRLGMGVKAAAIAIGLLLCFFGLKLTRILAALAGLGAGGAAGFVITLAAGTKGTVSLVIILACGIIAALLSLFLYKPGAFLLVFSLVMSSAVSILGVASGFPLSVSLGRDSLVMGGIVLAVSLVLAVLAVIFSEPVIIVATSVTGGMTAGPVILLAAGLSGKPWMSYAAGGLLFVLGMGVQFLMQSRKIGRKEKSYADEKREKDSVESEVEKARNILKEDEEEE